MNKDGLSLYLTTDSKDMQAGVKDGAKALDQLDSTVKKTSKDAKELGRESQKTEEEISRVGNTSMRTGRGVESLGRSVEETTRRTQRLGQSMQSLQTSGKLLAYGSDKILNSYSALAGGAGFGLAMKSAIGLRHEMVQMGIAARDMDGNVAGMSFAKWLETTHEKILNTSIATGQSADSLTAGMRAIVQRTGNMAQAVDQIELLGQAATATGSEVGEVAALASQLDQKAGVKGVDAMRQALTLFIAQGKTGAFEMRDMVSQGETLMSVMPLFGGKGMDGLKSFGAFIQMARTAVGSGAEAATTIEALGRVMANIPEVEKKLGKVGLNVKLDRNGTMEENIKKIIVASNGDLKRLTASGAFEREGVRAIQTMANNYAAGRGFEQFETFKSAGGDLSKNTMLQEDFATATADSKVQMDMLLASLRKVSDEMLDGTIGVLTRFMQGLGTNAKGTQDIIRHIIKDLLLVASIAAAVKVVRMGREIRDMLGGGSRGGGAAVRDALGGGGAGVQKVFVVNMAGGGMGGGGSLGSGGGEMYGPPRPVGRWDRWGRSAAMGAGIAGLGMLDSFSESGNTPEGWARAAGGVFGTAVGMVLGGPVGAMAGQRIGDFIGMTLAGAIKGSLEQAEAKRKEEDRVDPLGVERTSKFLGKNDATAVYARRPVADKPTGFLDQFKPHELSEKDKIQLNIVTQIDANGRSSTKVTGPGSSLVRMRSELAGLESGIRPNWAAAGVGN